MENEKVTITLHMLPPSLNTYSRMHWSKQRQEANTWKDDIYLGWLELGEPVYQRVRITLVFTFPAQRRRDLDNYMAMGSKFVGDAVKGLFIPDDIPKYLTGWSFRFETGETPQTTIIIENADRSKCSGLSCTGGS